MRILKNTLMEALRRRAYALAVSPESTAAERETMAWLLYRCEMSRPADGRSGHELAAARVSFALRAELPDDEMEEVNPLDDDERLRQVRMEVFGCVPE